jgi:hypothetical protein
MALASIGRVRAVSSIAAFLFVVVVLGMFVGVLSSRWDRWSRPHRRVLIVVGAIVGLIALAGRLVDSRQAVLGNDLEMKIAGSLSSTTPREPELLVQGGRIVHVSIEYKNASSRVLNDITVRADMPPDLAILPGTISLSDASRVGLRLSDSALSSGGINLGSYSSSKAGIAGRIEFLVKIDEEINCNSLVIGFGRASGSLEKSKALVLLLDKDSDGRPDGATCRTPAPRGGGWGPDRQIYDWNREEDRVGGQNGPVFNSFINIPWYGDQRNFVVAARGNAYDVKASFHDPLTGIADAQSIGIRILVDNGANDALNSADERGVARGTRVRVKIAEHISPVNGLDVAGFVDADNSLEVYKLVALSDEQTKFSVRYRAGSAKLYNRLYQSGTSVSDDIVAGGALIGYERMDGNFPAGFNFAAYVTVVLDVIPA